MDSKQLEKEMGKMDKLGELLGLNYEETMKKAKDMMKECNDPMQNLKDAFNIGTVADKHKTMLDVCKKTLWNFANCDKVECNIDLLNENMIEVMWKNVDIYSYDIENFFLDKFEFILKKGNEIMYKMFFSIEDKNIFLYVENADGIPFVGGTIIIKDGKFMPYGAIEESVFPTVKLRFKKQGMATDSREAMGDFLIMNNLLYILIVNQMVNQNKEVITETSKRIEVQSKNQSKNKNKKKKKKTKKTIQIRYIKVDGQKIERIRHEHERQQREAYERHTESWSRRGHYKTLRNGERVWIKPTTCHAQTKTGEKIPKLYKLK